MFTKRVTKSPTIQDSNAAIFTIFKNLDKTFSYQMFLCIFGSKGVSEIQSLQVDWCED